MTRKSALLFFSAVVCVSRKSLWMSRELLCVKLLTFPCSERGAGGFDQLVSSGQRRATLNDRSLTLCYLKLSSCRSRGADYANAVDA
jgi:hypothetical protein